MAMIHQHLFGVKYPAQGAEELGIKQLTLQLMDNMLSRAEPQTVTFIARGKLYSFFKLAGTYLFSMCLPYISCFFIYQLCFYHLKFSADVGEK